MILLGAFLEFFKQKTSLRIIVIVMSWKVLLVRWRMILQNCIKASVQCHKNQTPTLNNRQ